MGRSRLIYRSKHRGTLSENSRREIREAHAKRNQEKKDSAINESEIIEEVDKQSEEDSTDDEVQEVPSCDILTFPKLYIRECEFTDYAKHIDMKDRQQSILFPNIQSLATSLQQIPLADMFASEFYDDNISSLFTSTHSSVNEISDPIIPSLKNEESSSPTKSISFDSKVSRVGVDVDLQNQLDSLLGL